MEMVKRKSAHKFPLKAAAIGAVILVAVAIAFASLSLLVSQPEGQGVGTVRSDWTMLEQAASAPSSAPTGTEITLYQISQQSYNPLAQMQFSYSGGLGLVKEKRSASLLPGQSWISLSDVGSHIDPTSIIFKDLTDGRTQLLEQNYDYDLVSQEKLLEKYVDKTITVEMDNETVSGKLLSSSWGGIVLQTDKGIVTINNYNKIVYPALPEGLLTKPTISWLVNSPLAGNHDLQLSYLTSGVSWSADYVAVANFFDTAIDLQGWVSVENNAGTSFKDANLKLVAGDIHLVEATPIPYPRAVMAMETSGAASKVQFTEEGLFEYHLYTLGRPTTIKDGELKQITLFSAQGVLTEKQLVFEPSASSKVRVKLIFENKKSNGLGIPLPKGKVRVYKPDSSGQLQFLGEDQIDHTPEDEKVRLFLGDAFDVIAERTETDHQEINWCTTERSYEISLRNHKTEIVAVNVLEDASGEWTIPKESDPHAKDSAHKISWKVQVPAGGEKKLTYTIRESWC